MFRYFFTQNNNKQLFCSYLKKLTVYSLYKERIHSRSLTGDKIVRLDKNSLQPRILKYFKECVQPEKSLNENIKSITLLDYHSENLIKMNNEKLIRLIYYLSEPRLNQKDFKTCIKNLDKECCSRLPNFSTPEIFQCLDNFMHFLPHYMTRLSFYTKSIQKMSFYVEHCTKIELLQLCFYVGLQKKTRESQIILKRCLQKLNHEHLNNLNLNDVVILCNSSYKTSTKIGFKKLLNLAVDQINNNIAILSDATFFVTIIKSLRHNQYQSEELLTTVSHGIFFNNTIKFYNFTACTHILALYADALYYDGKLINLLSDKCLTNLREMKSVKLKMTKIEHFSKQIRVKDISRFLWSLSYIGHSFDKNIISDEITPLLLAYIKLRELENNIEHFIDSLLSMWIIGHRPSQEFLSTVITKNTVSLIHGKRKQRFNARLNLLLTCIEWEEKEAYNNLNVTVSNAVTCNIKSQIDNRLHLKFVYNSLRRISSIFDIKKIEYTSPVPHLNIVGITGFDQTNKPTLYLELVDNSLSVKNKNEMPHGLMSLKIRLLKTFGKTILIISENEIAEKTPAQLDKYLQKKLKRVYVP